MGLPLASGGVGGLYCLATQWAPPSSGGSSVKGLRWVEGGGGRKSYCPFLWGCTGRLLLVCVSVYVHVRGAFTPSLSPHREEEEGKEKRFHHVRSSL